MPKALTPVTQHEVLPAALTKGEADKVERKAISLYVQAQKTSVQFAAELYRLQEGQAHLTRGFSNFGTYAENTFEGVSSVNAFAISRQGRILVILENHNRISLEGQGKNLPGTTGLRALAKIYKDFGEEAMLAVYDRALETGGKVIEETVLAATRELVAPKLHELGEGAEEEPEEEEGEDAEEPELPAKQRELIDHIRDLAYELPETATEMQEALTRLQAEQSGTATPEDEKWIESKR